MRRVALILWVGAALLAAANGLVYAQGRPKPPSPADGVWQRWSRLDRETRLTHVRTYQTLVQAGDTAAVLRLGRKFAQYPPPRRQALRELHEALQDVLQHEGPAGRKDLLRSTPPARAFFAYQALAATDPARLARLAEQLRTGS
jgi:hypothetical protein